MKLNDSTLSLVLSEEFRAVAELLGFAESEMPVLLANVREVDDTGMWIRLMRGDGEHVVLVRWEYILSADISERTTRSGFRAE